MLYRKILVAFDGSAGSWKALRKAITLANDQGSELLALSIIEEHLPHFAATVGEVQEKEQENHYSAKVQGEAIAEARRRGVPLATEIRTKKA